MSRFEVELEMAATPALASQLRASGISLGRIRGPSWHRVRNGLYVPAPGPTENTAQRIINAAAMLPDGSAVAGWAAAYVSGVDWLDGKGLSGDDTEPVDVITSAKRRSDDLLRYHFTREPIDSRIRHGIPVTPPLRTAVDGARWASSIEDAVVFLDAMVRFRQVSIRALRQHLESLRSVHGLQQARAALDLTRTNVWSPRESRLRYCYEIEAGLPPPLLIVRVFDDEGVLIGHPDLFDPEAALATEFDGAQHRDREQHRKDNIREERFESVGVTVTRSDSLDLRPGHRHQLVHRLQDAHRRGLNRNRTHDRWLLDPRAWPETT